MGERFGRFEIEDEGCPSTSRLSMVRSTHSNQFCYAPHQQSWTPVGPVGLHFTVTIIMVTSSILALALLLRVIACAFALININTCRYMSFQSCGLAPSSVRSGPFLSGLCPTEVFRVSDECDAGPKLLRYLATLALIRTCIFW